MDAPTRSWRSKLARKLGAEVSSRSLALVRIAAALTIWTKFTSPWVTHRMDDVGGAMVLAWVVLLAAWFVIFGFKTRWAAASMALAFAGLHLYYGVHLGDPKLAAPVQEIQLAVLIALTPCGRSLSIDRALEVRRAYNKESRPPPPERIGWWQLELFVIQAASVFLWLGVGGMGEDWLSGERLQRNIVHWYGSDTFAAHPGLPWLCEAAAWGLTIAEFVIAAGLLLRRLRPYVMGFALTLLFINMLLMAHSLAAFYTGLIMAVPLLACASPTTVHALVADQSVNTASEPEIPPAGATGLWLPVVALAAMTTWSNIPPYRGHIKAQPRDLFAWTWSLHEPRRSRVCDLRYYDMNRGGAIIERWKLLGHEHPGGLPEKHSRIQARQVRADGRRVCAALRKAGDNPPKVELDARCLLDDGWQTVDARKHNLCSPAKR